MSVNATLQTLKTTMKTKRINRLLHEAVKIEPQQIISLSFRPPLEEVAAWRIVCTEPFPSGHPIYSADFDEGGKWQNEKDSMVNYTLVPLPSDAIPALRAEAVEDEERAFTLSDYKPAFKAANNPLYTWDRWNYYVWRPIPEPERESIRKSVHLQRQQQRNAKRGRRIDKLTAKQQNKKVEQLEFSLVETLSSGNTLYTLDSSGVSISPVAYNVSHAFQVLLSDTGYSEDDKLPLGHNRLTFERGNFATEGDRVHRYVIYSSRNELLEKAGYTRGANGRFSSRDAKAIEKAIQELDTEKHKINYTRGSGKNKFEVNVETSLAHIDKISIEKLPEELSSLYDKREVFYRIELHPIYADGFRAKMLYRAPRDLPLLIAECEKEIFGRARRQTNYPSKFIEYLLSLSNNPPISEAKLAERLGIAKTLKQRHKKRDFERIIGECVAVAKDIKILDSWELVDGNYHFTLHEM